MKKNSILDDILSDQKTASKIKEEDQKLEPLLDEIDLIKDENIKSFVFYFFIVLMHSQWERFGFRSRKTKSSCHQ